MVQCVRVGTHEWGWRHEAVEVTLHRALRGQLGPGVQGHQGGVQLLPLLQILRLLLPLLVILKLVKQLESGWLDLKPLTSSQ